MLPTEKPFQPMSFSARTTNSAGHEYRVNSAVESQNSGESSTSRMTAFMSPPVCRYTELTRATNVTFTAPNSVTKKRYSLVAMYRAVLGCAARPLMKSMPSCMPAAAARAGIVLPPSGYTAKLNVLAVVSCEFAL